MLKKLAMVKGPAGDYGGKMGVVVAIRDEQQDHSKMRTCSYKILVDGQISGWLPGEWLEWAESHLRQGAAI